MKLDSTLGQRLILIASFAAAILLAIMPWPAWAEVFRPDWVGLVLVYWCLAAPQRVGVGTGWLVGLVLDVLYGSLLGLHALSKALVAFIAVRFHLQIRMFPRWQQAVSVFLLISISHVLLLWIKGSTSERAENWAYFIPAIVSGVLWPWLFIILRDVRRRAKIA